MALPFLLQFSQGKQGVFCQMGLRPFLDMPPVM